MSYESEFNLNQRLSPEEFNESEFNLNQRLSPEEFKEKIEGIILNLSHDKEYCHHSTDGAMENLLIALGYGEAIRLIKTTTRWYT